MGVRVCVHVCLVVCVCACLCVCVCVCMCVCVLAVQIPTQSHQSPCAAIMHLWHGNIFYAQYIYFIHSFMLRVIGSPFGFLLGPFKVLKVLFWHSVKDLGTLLNVTAVSALILAKLDSLFPPFFTKLSQII